MNKRWNSRKPISLGLVINYPALGLLRGKATNLSLEGMFIETAATSLCNFADIEITMNLPEISDKPIHLDAVIVHNTDNGIGITFRHEHRLNDYQGQQKLIGLAALQQLLAKNHLDYRHAS